MVKGSKPAIHEDVDLVLRESADGRIHAALDGEKARADRWTLEADAAGSALTIESEFEQEAILNLKDRPKRELIVSLPKKTYDSLRLSESSNWRDATFQVPEPDGTLRTWKASDLAGRKELATAFGTLALSE